eukprot:gene11470-17643_t
MLERARAAALLLLLGGFAGAATAADTGLQDDQVAGAALCTWTPGRPEARLYALWGFPSIDACEVAVPSKEALLTSADTYAIAINTSERCLPQHNAVPVTRWFRVEDGTCVNGSSGNQHDQFPSAHVYVYSKSGCPDESLTGSVYISQTTGLCQACNVGDPYEEEEEEKWTTRFIIIICLTPFVTALIGYGTNVIAIKMIFRPYKPRCGFSLGICGPSKSAPGRPKCHFRGIQGVFPKRQHGLALQLGNMVEKNLISADEMVGKMKKELGLDDAVQGGPSTIDDELEVAVRHAVETMLEKKADNRMGVAFINMFGGKEVFTTKLTKAAIDIITDRIRYKMTPQDLEEMFMSFMDTELGFVEQLGGVLGFIVGMLQTGIFILTGT